MKLLLTVLVALITINGSFAQELSKDETKKIKKELKGYIKDPASYVRKIENYETTAADLETKLSDAKNTVSNQEKTITDMTTELGQAKASLADAEAQVTEMSTVISSEAQCKSFPEGSTYRVQIGLYAKFNISDYFEQNTFVMFEPVDGMSRYSVGNFNNMQEAINFKKDMRLMGIRDAFVTEYVDGQRNKDFSEPK